MLKRIMPPLVVLLSLSVAGGNARAEPSPQIPLPGSAIPQFVHNVPLLSVAGGTLQAVVGSGSVTVHMCEFKARVLPSTFVPPAGSAYAGYTWVWGYLPESDGRTRCTDLIALYGDTDGILDTYIGPVVLNERNSSTDFTWVNDLPDGASTNVLAWKYSTDQTLHWADPLNDESNMCNHMDMFPPPGDPCAGNYRGPVPAVIHLHGGEVPPALDGGPDAWITGDGAHKGHSYYTFPGAPGNGATYRYPNTQEASPIWFHDHALGITRLNVYAGLAGAYLISDPLLTLPAGMHPYGLKNNGAFEPTVPLVIQDRTFDTNGQLFLHAAAAGGLLWAPNPEHPYWVPEFAGDVIVVNGKAWPRFNAQQKRYRFLFLNGSNARTYEMFLVNPVTGAAGPNMWVIATDGGYLDAPVMVKKLTMMPGERYEVIIDFAFFPGQWLLKNTGKTPFPAGEPPRGATTAKVMMFNVAAGAPVADGTFNPATPGQVIRPNGRKIVRLPGTPGGPAIVTAAGTTRNVQATRALTLNEVMGVPQSVINPVTGLPTAYPGGPLEILLNNTKWSGERITGVDGTANYTFEAIPGFTGITAGGNTTYYSELPREGDTEVWEIINLTADAHPIHLHLVQFQLIDRQNFNTHTYGAVYDAAFPGGGYDPMLVSTCAAGVFCPGYGPPLSYAPSAASGGKYGGNPDVGMLGRNGKPLYLQGKSMPPRLNERGWKDTVIAFPRQVTRLAVRWAPTDLAVQATGNLGSLHFPFDPNGGHGYVWHCHIIDHEDNEMMRPTAVVPLGGATRTLEKGIDY